MSEEVSSKGLLILLGICLIIGLYLMYGVR